MVVSIGVFHLKKRSLLPEFLKLSKTILQESIHSNGNLKSELDNEGIKVFYSYTFWDSDLSMKNFVQSNTHGLILKDTSRLCSEAAFLNYEIDNFESIEFAKQKLLSSKKTRVIKYN